MAAGQARGFNLPELMVSMAIGLVLLAAFIKVLDRSLSDFAVNESLARLQDAFPAARAGNFLADLRIGNLQRLAAMRTDAFGHVGDESSRTSPPVGGKHKSS